MYLYYVCVPENVLRDVTTQISKYNIIQLYNIFVLYIVYIYNTI